MFELTKEADAMICLLYKEYLERRQSGVSIDDAKSIGSDEDIKSSLTPKWSLEDVSELCRSLSRKDLLQIYSADNHVIAVYMTDEGIIYMENRFKNKVSSVLEYLSKIKDLICLPLA